MTDQAVLDTISDFDAALDRLARAGSDRVEQRKALREALACLYELRCYWTRRLTTTDYRAKAAETDGGKTADAIIWLRGSMTHDLVKEVGPVERPLFPSERLFPSPRLFPGPQLTWRRLDEMDDPPEGGNAAQRDAYTSLVAGLPVLPSLDRARHFFARLL